MALAAGLLAASDSRAAPDPAAVADAQPGALSTESFIDWYNPRVHPGIVLGCAGLAALFCAYAAVRREKYAAPYVCAAALFTTMLIDPRMVQRDFEEAPTDVIVVVDQSDSQKIDGREQRILEARDKLLTGFKYYPGVNVRVVDVDNRPDSSGESRGTRIFAALDALEGVSADNLRAVVLITDGQVDDVPAVSPFGGKVPVHVLLSGRQGEKDRAVTLVDAPAFGVSGQKQTLRIRVDDKGEGLPPSERVSIELTGSGQDPQTLEATPGETVEMSVMITHPGPNLFSVKAAPLDGELTFANNQIVASVDGIRRVFNILLVSGGVNSSVLDLRAFYEADSGSNLVHYMPMRWPEQVDKTPPEELALTKVPLNEIFNALRSYDVVVLDHYANYQVLPLLYIKKIVDFVQGGGSLIVMSGPEYAGNRSLQTTPLRALLPVAPLGQSEEGEFVPRLTETGKRHPITQKLSGANVAGGAPSWGPWIRALDGKLLSGHVLMETADGKPLLVVRDLEAGTGDEATNKKPGRIVMLNSDSPILAWARGYKGGGPGREILSNLSHYAARDPDMAEETLVAFAGADDEIVVERRTISDQKPPPVLIETPDGKTEPLEFEKETLPGVWQTAYTPSVKGVYRLHQEEGNNEPLEAYLNVGENRAAEMTDVISTPDLVRPVVEATGGGIYRIEGADGNAVLPTLKLLTADAAKKGKAGSDWMGFARNDEKVLRGLSSEPLIPGWAGLTLTAVFMAWGFSGRRVPWFPSDKRSAAATADDSLEWSP